MAGFGKRTATIAEPIRPTGGPPPLAFSGENAGPSRPLGRRTAIIVLGGVAALLVAAFGSVTHMISSAPAGAAPFQTVEQALANDPGSARMYAVMRQSYPTENADLIKRAAGPMRRGDSRSVERLVMKASIDLVRRDARYIETASTASLVAVVQATADMLGAAQEQSPEFCISLSKGAIGLADLSHANSIKAVGALQVAAIFEAVQSGQTSPVVHAAPSDADGMALAQVAMASGITEADMKALNAAKDSATSTMPAAKQCDTAIRMMRSIARTPEPARSRIIGLTAKSAAQAFQHAS